MDRLSSGIWQYRSENGTDLMLEAYAIHAGSHKLLIIQNVTQSGTALEFLQQGRGSQLEMLRDLALRRQLEIELRAGQEQARRLDRAKTEFVANVSHEMRTPLTTILGMCELLAESSLDQEQRAHLQALEDSANSLFAVVKDLLDVASIESGKISIQRTSFSPVALVHKVERDYRPAANQRGIDLKIQTGDDVPDEIYSDPNRLRQILNNLVDNAIKFTRRGTVTLALKALSDDTAGPQIVFQVQDTGIGIRQEQQGHIFGAFAQSDDPLIQNKSGVGLGLSIAQRLTAAIAGDISVASAPGQGSIFTLIIPARDPTHSETHDARNHHPAPRLSTQEPANNRPKTGNAATPANNRPEAGDHKRLNVLVAEDNPINRKFFVQILSKRGHQVTAVTNGQEALDALDQADQRFDVLLLDCQMPLLDGYDTAQTIRQQEATTGAHLPIIAVTAHAMDQNRQRCIQAGMDLFVTKPFKTLELLAMVQSAAMLGKTRQ